MRAPNADQRPIPVRSERVHRVESRFFALYGMPIVAGRAFAEADLRAGATAAIVNQVFAEKVFDGSAVIGRRLRFVRESDRSAAVEAGPWLEIVGVVRDFEGLREFPERQIYLPADIAQNVATSQPRDSHPREPGDELRAPAPGTGRGRRPHAPARRIDQRGRTAQAVAPGSAIHRDRNYGGDLSVLLLSAAGIYAMMSFTVARRRREIGIRSALGADAGGY